MIALKDRLPFIRERLPVFLLGLLALLVLIAVPALRLSSSPVEGGEGAAASLYANRIDSASDRERVLLLVNFALSEKGGRCTALSVEDAPEGCALTVHCRFSHVLPADRNGLLKEAALLFASIGDAETVAFHAAYSDQQSYSYDRGSLESLFGTSLSSFSSSEEGLRELSLLCDVMRLPEELTSAVRTLVPSPVAWDADLPLGEAVFTLDYASDARLIFRVSSGLFVYDLRKQSIVQTLDLAPFGCSASTGAVVPSDGSKVLFQLEESEFMYVYDIASNSLTQTLHGEPDGPVALTTALPETPGVKGRFGKRAISFGPKDYGFLYVAADGGLLGSLSYKRGSPSAPDGCETYVLFVK